jgi:DNA (cytosine-5)-methyltransferase 1
MRELWAKIAALRERLAESERAGDVLRADIEILMEALDRLAYPAPTVTSGGNHVAEVRAFLVKYFGTATGQDAADPLGTVTGRARFGLVLVDGVPHQIIDIGMRMLEPEELLRAQFGPYADEYVLIGSKARKIHAIGNSVPPQVAEALVRANMAA